MSATVAGPGRTAAADGGRVTFAGDGGFYRALKRRVHDDLRQAGLSAQDSPRLYLKTAVLLLWFGASYALLVFAAATFWQGALLAGSLALAMAGIGFGVQHDANHGAYSRRGGVNRLMGATLDLLGGSSYVWQWKHNIFHHTYPNLNGVDDDIDVGPFARLAPEQPRYRPHRFQHIYVWALYGFLGPKWQLLDDFKSLARARIAGRPFPRPRGLSLLQVIGGKAIFVGWAFALPLLFHPFWVVALFYVATAWLVGLVLGVVFQLAHCVEEADFPAVPPGDRPVPGGWAVHQVQTTVDFARRNRLLTWYVGGLNFQIEHHLFPRICHVHYPRISAIVEAFCAERGVRYAAHDGFLAAVRSHWRWLRRMGRPVGGRTGAAAAAAPAPAAGSRP